VWRENRGENISREEKGGVSEKKRKTRRSSGNIGKEGDAG